MVGLSREDYERVLFYKGENKEIKRRSKHAWDEVYSNNDVHTFKRDREEVTKKILVPILDKFVALVDRIRGR